MSRFPFFARAFSAIASKRARLALAAVTLVAGFAGTAEAQVSTYVDPSGREWMRIDDTFAFAGSVPSLCNPACSGIVTKYTYSVQHNSYTNPQQLSLDGWAWASKDEVQALMDTTDILSLGLSYMFVTTYSYSEGVHALTSTVDAASGQYYVGYAYFGHNMVSFSYGAAIVPAGSAPSTGPRGAFLYRLSSAGGILANDDVGRVPSPAGGVAVANVLANDFVDGTPATLANPTISAAPVGAISLNAATGEVVVAPGAAAGVHTLTYQACVAADPAVCDSADVTVTVPAYVIDARNDAGTAGPNGGIAVASVLGNDSLGGVLANVASVALALVSSDHGGITLDVSDGSVDVAGGTPLGTYALVYSICERANPTNCDTATATVTVAKQVIYAGDDSARVSSKVANTAIASVFANDTLGGVRASSSNVRLSLVTAPPRYVVLDTNSGAVRVTRKTSSGLYRFTYRICELTDLTNCDDAVVTLDLTGSGS